MKFLLTLSLIILTSMKFCSQTLSYEHITDSLFQHLDKSGVNTGMLYDRVFPISSLNEFNKISSDTTSMWHFVQAYSEIYRSRYTPLPGWPLPKEVRKMINLAHVQNEIPIGIGNYEYNVLEPNSVDLGLIRLEAVDSLYYDVPGRFRSPFNLQKTFIAGALIDSAKTGILHFKFSPEFNFSNSSRTISTLSVDFGDGSGLQTVSLNSIKNINYQYPGTINIKFVATFSDNTSTTTYSTFRIYQDDNIATKNGSCQNPETFDIWSTLSFKGYDEDVATIGKGDVTLYYSLTNNCDGIIRKPIIIIDGFDPGDAQSGEKLYNDYLNDANKGKLGDSLRLRGYDIFILNFPQYAINGQVRDGGADYIERNARVLIELINSINQMKQGNEKLVVIGPSMGGLISRYALRYMEQQQMPHHTRLWISFDSPHHGANIPIGDQQWLDFYGRMVKSELIIKNRDEKIGSPAARQMLIKHYNYSSTVGQNEFKDIFDYTINQMGFPVGDTGQPLRKIALINGSIGGTEINTPEQKGFTFDIRRWHNIDLLLFKIRYTTYTVSTSRMYFTGSYGAQNNIFSGWYLNKTRNYLNATPSYTSGVDVAPGGTYYTQRILAKEGDGQIESVLGTKNHGGGIRFIAKFYSVVPDHSFINTKSALAFSGSNQNLSEDISGRSLVCSGETPFDSYFADYTQNREHVTLWDAAIKYILQEIDGYPQLPIVKSGLAISGASNFCSQSTYTIPNLPSGSVVKWTINKPAYATLNAIGSNNQSVSVTSTVFNASLILSAEIKSSCGRDIIVKNISFGPPAGGYVTFSNSGAPSANPYYLNQCEREGVGTFYFIDNEGNSYNAYDNPGYEFEIVSGANCNFELDRYHDFYFNIYPASFSGTATVTIKVKNNCGWSDPYNVDLLVQPPCGNYSKTAIYPNPASDYVVIGEQLSTVRQNIGDYHWNKKIELYNDKGQLIERKNGPLPVKFKTLHLASGIYFLHIITGDKIEKKQIMVRH